MEKDKKIENRVFGWLGTKMGFALKCFLNNSKTQFFRKAKKGIFVDAICFWKMYFFCDHFKSPNNTKLGFQRAHGENPKWHFWFEKGCFGEGLRKRFLLSVIHKAVLWWKHYFYSVWRAQVEKTKVCQKNGVCSSTCKKVIFVFWIFGGVVLFFVVFFLEAPKKIMFLQFWRFFLFRSPQKPSL